MRIFWFSMHKVLMETELPRLRALGFEVFVPPYLSLLTDQSAVREWDGAQPSSLPPPVYSRLAKHNFFDGSIPTDIAEILNAHFDACLVTMNVDWVSEIAKVYKGKLIFRTYGQVGRLSEMLEERGMLPMLTERDNFWWMPHAEEASLHEHDWFKERMRVVPYCVTPDVKQRQGVWGMRAHRHEIMAMSPNIANPYYFQKYRFLKNNFSDLPIRIYGVQTTNVRDPQVAGTLPRAEFLDRYESAAGYLYSYQDPDVCYLPPIEMMVIGGPVVFLPGSLLSRYFTVDPPGLARNVDEARQKCCRLLANDREFADQIIRSQEPIVARYDPEKVWPLFDAALREALSSKGDNKGRPPVLSPRAENKPRDRIYLFSHESKGKIFFQEGVYRSENRLMDRLKSIVGSLMEKTPFDVVVTCHPRETGLVYGYFNAIEFRDRFLVAPLNAFASKSLNDRVGIRRRLVSRLKPVFLRAKQLSRYLLRNATGLHGWLGGVFHSVREKADKALMSLVVERPSVMNSLARSLVRGIDEDPACVAVLVPGPEGYPETADFKKRKVIRISDFDEKQIFDSLHQLILKRSHS